MKTLNLGGMAMVLIAGCGGLSDADSADLSQEAEVVSSPLESGHYGDVLDVVVTDGTISGRFKDSVGDPLHGGASCEFTFSGKLGTGKSMISVVDGYSHVAGTLSVKANAKPGKPGVVLRLNADPSACSRAAPVLLETSGVSFELTRKMDAGVAGYRSVSAEKAFFYDAPGKA